jgi:pimeloyl-ACP methyl ester carboxylesterase
LEVEVEALRADPTPIEQLEVSEIIDMLEKMIGELDSPPIIMGHSAGGAFTQILLDHGFGAVGVAINSAPTEGVKVIPLSQIKSSFHILKNPANRHRAVGLTPEQWYYVFANTFSEEESLALYERYHIPASGRIFWGSALANIHPGKGDTYVDYHNDARPPLLFISGKQDPLFPPKVGHSNVQALRVEHRDRDRGVRRTTSPSCDTRVGGPRGLRARLGPEARHVPLRMADRSPPSRHPSLLHAERAADRRPG